MATTTKITVSLPTRLLERADAKLARNGEGRSTMIRRLIEEALREAEEQEKVAQYVRGWQDNPPTDEEFGWAGLGLGSLRELPWR